MKQRKCISYVIGEFIIYIYGRMSFLKALVMVSIGCEGIVFILLYWSQVELRVQEEESNTLPNLKTSRYLILSTIFLSVWIWNKFVNMCY